MIKLIFLGSSAFAVPSLRAVVEIGINPLVLTKPDKPAKRGNKLSGTPVKEAATALHLCIRQPTGLKDAAWLEFLEGEKPDLILSIAYGEYIPPEVFRMPRHGCINLHPSLLPKYRGAAPVQRALMAGEEETGITLAYITEAWDAGDILLQEPYPIDPDENAGTLLEKLSVKGALLIKKAIPLLLQHALESKPQVASEATFAPKITEAETWIHWGDPASRIRNLIRGLSPDPSARTRIEKSLLKIHQARVMSKSGAPGRIVALENQGPVVATGEKSLLLLKVQPENRNVMSGKDFINGYPIQTGQSFGS